MPLIGKSRVRRLEESTEEIAALGEEKWPMHTIQYEIDTAQGKKSLTVLFPAENPSSAQEMNSMVDDLVAEIPYTHGDANSQVFLFPDIPVAKLDGRDFNGLAYEPPTEDLGKRRIDLYGSALKDVLQKVEILWHETGHQLTQKIWQTADPSTEWARAVVLDGNFISDYATTQRLGQLREDFAETFRAYIGFDAGRLLPELRRYSPNRVAVLDKIFAQDNTRAVLQAELQPILQPILAKNAQRLGLAFTVAGGAAGGGILVWRVYENRESISEKTNKLLKTPIPFGPRRIKQPARPEQSPPNPRQSR